MTDGPLSKVGLQRIYQPFFHGSNLHHLVPKTRNGHVSEFNLFPYDIKRHAAYHYIFYNLRIDEVWEMLDDIHASIFESDEDSVYPWWVEKCKLENGTIAETIIFNKNKQGILNKRYSVIKLQAKWAKAFGSEDLKTSKEFLKLMMLFMIFGTKLLDKDTLFDNGNLVHFIEKTPCTNIRLWAFERCFGHSGTTHSMKSKIVSIVDRFDYYSDVIL